MGFDETLVAELLEVNQFDFTKTLNVLTAQSEVDSQMSEEVKEPEKTESLALGLREKIPSRVLDKNPMLEFVIFMLESLDGVLHHCVVCRE